MPTFQSNEEFFAALRHQIERWCDQRRLAALALLLPAYTAFNGLTDGWADLYEALKATRALGQEESSPNERELLNDLIRAAERAIYRH
jgi:hypothetical protein